MPCVGEQAEGVAHEARNSLDDDEGQVQRYRHYIDSRQFLYRMRVVVMVETMVVVVLMVVMMLMVTMLVFMVVVVMMVFVFHISIVFLFVFQFAKLRTFSDMGASPLLVSVFYFSPFEV